MTHGDPVSEASAHSAVTSDRPEGEDCNIPGAAASTLSRESRGVRLGGLALMFIAVIPAAMLDDAADPGLLVPPLDLRRLLPLAAAIVATANAFGLGLVMLLAGMRQLSLLTSAAARRGALARIIAINLLLVGGAFAAAQDSGALTDAFYESWYALLFIVVFVAIAHAGVRLFRAGWKHEARSADEVMRADPRPPVVYLRSFAIDDQVLVSGGGVGSQAARLLTYTASVSPEQEMAFILDRIGPVIAIGKPGERLPQLGAARVYVGDDEWRDVVGGWLDRAALIVLRAGETEGLWWEVTQALERCPPRKVVIVILGPHPAFERRFCERFGRPIAPASAPESPAWVALVRLIVPYGRSAGRIIHFDEQARPYEIPLEHRLTWSGAVLSPYRPYRDSLNAAFKRLFAALDIPWTQRRNATTAVLLAFFGGIFGLHQFYMGHPRKGWRYLAFFWLVVPMVLGWIDAARLALLDDEQFRLRLGPSHRPGTPQP